MRKINPDLNSRDRIGSDTIVLVLLGEELEVYIQNYEEDSNIDLLK